VATIGDRVGPRRIYGVSLRTINEVSDRIHTTEMRDLRTSLAAVLLPTGVLVGLAFAFTPTEGVYDVGTVRLEDLPIVALLLLAVAAAVTAARDRGRLRPVLALSVLGFALAAVYAVVGAPDVALVAVVVETVLTLVFVGVYSRLPPMPDRTASGAQRRLRRRNAVSGVIAGVAAFATIWAALSRTNVGVADAEEQTRLTPAAHGTDVVTVILADFRGLDTLVEITVLATAIIGVALLLRRGKAW
jgi:multicomponent Na+:H+ antiporter subunit A